MAETALDKTADSLADQAQLKALLAAALEEAEKCGASASEAAVSCSTALSVNVRLNEVEKLQHHRGRSLAVTVYFDRRKGSASTSDWSGAALRDTVRAACDIARYTAADPCAGLADPERLAKPETMPELDLNHPWALTADAAIAIAKSCETTAREFDSRIQNSEGAGVSSSAGLSYYGNSNGFTGGYASTRHGINCSVIARDDSGMQRSYWYTVARDHTELETTQAVGKQAGERAVNRLGARRIKTQKAPVIFAPDMARGVISHFLSAISGASLYRKASFLVDHAGKKIFPEHVTMREEPHLPKALASAPFDNEGVATQARELVSCGILQGYILDSYAARRLGLETTGNSGGVHNIIVEPGALGFNAMLAEMDRGLLVTSLMGQGINMLTGDYSRGASGFWVEGGEIQFPVEEITIAGNLRDMFMGIAQIGNDVDYRGAVRCGSILIGEMTIAGD